MTDLYQRLLTLAKLEHELALQGEWEALERLDAERRELVAELPERPPAEAKELLVEMASVQAETTAVLAKARSQVADEIGDLERTGETARSYGRQATQLGGTFSAAA